MRYLIRRLRATVLVVLGVSVLVFCLVRLLPGDIATVLGGPEGMLNPSERQALLRNFGLDQPLPLQYGLWLWNMLHGNFGISFRTSQSVAGLLFSRLPLTVELALLTALASAAIGIPLGVFVSVSRSPRVRILAQVLGLLGLSVPSFWLAVVLILLASYTLGWLPPLVFVKLWDDPGINLQQMLLPVLSLAVGLSAVVLRMTRSVMLEALGEDYVKVARAKGLTESSVILHHALRNALIPIVTVVGLQLGTLLGGVVITEQVFGMPGLGWTLVNGVNQRDYPVVQGAVMLFALTFAVINLLVDLTYTYLDPRIRYE
ncbi:MAG: ABC transporter permease [Chloroflexota bacterium]|nr:ABC transporter permease [Chloroflexota bacterium]